MNNRYGAISIKAIKNILLVVILFGYAFQLQASDPAIDIGIFQPDDQQNRLEVRLKPNFDINTGSYFTNIIYFVRWKDPSLEIDNVESFSPYFLNAEHDMVPLFDEESGYYYQRFAGGSQSILIVPIPEGTEAVMSAFTFSGAEACPYFEIIDDDFAAENNGSFYMEFTGSGFFADDFAGTIYEPIAPIYVSVCPEPIQLCCDDDDLVLDMATPAGGTYEGPHVTFNGSDYVFSPVCSATGTFTVTYTDPGGCSSCTFTITVNETPEVTCPDNFWLFINEAPFPLTGASPEGGDYSGPGIVNNEFDPMAAGIGIHEITYVYQDPATECTNSCIFYISVREVSEVICPDDELFVCIDDEPFELTGESPEGGFYSGPGVEDGSFDPAIAGPGTHTITYTAQLPVAYWNFNFDIPEEGENWNQPIPAPIGNGDIVYTFSEAISLQGTTLNGIDAEESGGSFVPQGGTGNENNDEYFTINQSTDGFLNIVLSYALRRSNNGFDTHLIEYTTDGDNWIEKETIDVSEYTNNWSIDQIVVVDFSGIPDVNDNNDFAIRITVSGATSATGNNRFDNIRMDGIPIVNLACEFTIVVHELPEFDCPEYGPFCLGDDPVTFSETEGVFTYDGDVITGWDPTTAGDFDIVYTVTDEDTGCINTCTFTLEVAICGFTLDIKVFLEGPYDSSQGSMRTVLRDLDIMPTEQPYDGQPWNHTGDETVTELPADITDWILVELREASTANEALPANVEWRQALFLRNDGQVVSLDGTTLPFAEIIPEDNIYVVIRHRNHIAAMSANAMDEDTENFTLSYDFTDAADKAYFSNQKEIVTGLYGLYAGDVNQDKSIDGQDINVVNVDRNAFIFGKYLPTDVNLDATVDGSDLSITNANRNASVFEILPEIF